MGLLEFLIAHKPLFGRNAYAVKSLRKFLPRQDIGRVKRAINLGRVSFTQSSLGISKNIGEDVRFPALSRKSTDEHTQKFVEEINLKIERAAYASLFEEFSKIAAQVIPKMVAFQLHGMETVKQAIALQMFAKERVHILLLGDPGTGKTVFLQSVERLHPRTSFGLGSGTSGAGLAVTIKGKQIKPGLLPQAHKGICCIDELNLMKKEDYASLYSAMEKGFITYDKGGSHERFEADVRILATANPVGDKFRGATRDAIVRQLPFEPALLSRFTLVFLIRKPDVQAFVNIASDIVDKAKKTLNEGDVAFLHQYISHAESLEVEFPKSFKEQVVEFSREIKLAEERLFFEVSPRLIHGLINLSKARARMELRERVEAEDIQFAKELMLKALENRLD